MPYRGAFYAVRIKWFGPARRRRLSSATGQQSAPASRQEHSALKADKKLSKKLVN